MKIAETILTELSGLVSLKPANKKWYEALLTSICVGSPLLIGYYFDNIQNGLTAAICGLVIIYLPPNGSVTNKMLTLLVCSFGFMVSYAIGLFISVHPVLAVIGFGVFSFIIHYITLYYKADPPRSLFFILLMSMAVCQPFNISVIPTKLGLIGLGTMFACTVGLIYIFIQSRTSHLHLEQKVVRALKKNKFANYWEAIILGSFMGISLGVGKFFELNNPYWIPISCAAVMQGASLYHIWQRTFQRILGTFIGLGLCWLIIVNFSSTLSLFIFIIILQFLVELLIARQYALAVIFITPMTILLAETANPIMGDPNELIALRFTQITIGSFLGAFGGWLLHKEKLRYATLKPMAKWKWTFWENQNN